jgi:hypothetical protein
MTSWPVKLRKHDIGSGGHRGPSVEHTEGQLPNVEDLLTTTDDDVDVRRSSKADRNRTRFDK